MQDPIARMLSGYHMWRYFNCARKLFNPNPSHSKCADPPTDEWLASLLEEVEDDPDSVCFFGGASVCPPPSALRTLGSCIAALARAISPPAPRPPYQNRATVRGSARHPHTTCVRVLPRRHAWSRRKRRS